MAKTIEKIVTKGLIRIQSDALITPSDVVDNDNALFPSLEFEDGEAFEAANAIMVGITGNVAIRLVRKDEDGNAINSVLPGLAPGLWHSCEPFKQVVATGTTAIDIAAGVTAWKSSGVPGA